MGERRRIADGHRSTVGAAVRPVASDVAIRWHGPQSGPYEEAARPATPLTLALAWGDREADAPRELSLTVETFAPQEESERAKCRIAEKHE